MLNVRFGDIFIALLLASLVVVAAAAEDDDERVQKRESELKDGFSITDVGESGEKKWEVIGTSAQFISREEIELYDVKAFIYKKGKGDTLVTTSKATYDTKKKEIHSDQFVTVVSEESIVTGIGLLWKPKVRTIKILSNVKMDVSAEGERLEQ